MNLDSRWLLIAPALVTSYITLSFVYGYRPDCSFRTNCSHFLFGHVISDEQETETETETETEHEHERGHTKQQRDYHSSPSVTPSATSHDQHHQLQQQQQQQGFNRVARSGQVYLVPRAHHTMADDSPSSSPSSSAPTEGDNVAAATPTNSPSPSASGLVGDGRSSSEPATPEASPSPSYAAVLAGLHNPPGAAAVNAPGLRFGIGELQGRRPYMEDRSTAVMGLGTGDPHTATRCFFGVYDGHGGDAASSWCKQKMHLNLVKQPEFPDNMAAAMRTALLQTDREFLNKFPKSSLDDGSTVVFAVIELHSSRLIVANAGDSRGVISRSGVAEALSDDHKPDRPDERARVEAHGGMVQQASLFGKFMGPYRVYTRVRTGGLAVSRGLGDGLLKQNDLVIAEPEIREIHLAPGDEFMVLATDGVWDVFSNQQVVDFVRRHYNPSATSTSSSSSSSSSLPSADTTPASSSSASASSTSPSPSASASSTPSQQKDPAQVADLLVREAIQRGSLDNVTAIVIYFDNHHLFTGTPPTPAIQSRTSLGSAQDQKTATLTRTI